MNHVGSAPLPVGFRREQTSGIDPSIDDRFDHFTKWSETDCVYGSALAKTRGALLMRLANAERILLKLTPRRVLSESAPAGPHVGNTMVGHSA